MDSLHTSSKLGFRDFEGKSLEVPKEWQPALIEVRLPPDQRSQVKLFRQDRQLDVQLRTIQKQDCIVAEWERSDPGYYQLRLECGSTVEKRIVTVLPEKITLDAFTQLLSDLSMGLPAAVAVALQQVGAFGNLVFRTPQETTVAEELNRLRRTILGTEERPGLQSLLPKLALDPHQVLRSQEVWVPQAQARRLSISGLPQAMGGHNLDKFGKPVRVLDCRVEHTLDVYENRLVKLYVHQVERRLLRLEKLLTSGDDYSDCIPELQNLVNSLKKAKRQAQFLSEVSLPQSLTNQLTMVLLKRPAYRAVLEGFLEFCRQIEVRLDQSALDVPLQNLPYLYQLWGTLQVIKVLLKVAAEQGYRLKHNRLTRPIDNELVVVLPNGEIAVELVHPQTGVSVTLTPERTFETDRSAATYSISFKQRPDIVVEVKHPSSQVPSIYLFDPKYKVEWREGCKVPLKQDIDKMHSYRDAIRGVGGVRVVQYAAILYPGDYVQYDDGLEALPTHPLSVELLHNCLRPVFESAMNF
ncbi:DUF2357 domain-containing protein [Microcoleus sp. AR_TQ3_B6]|uniref:DUF2357 domain-containing protein n=1 Tax=Microcoleus sp. AR_TQ3_B6 TaxID=3055284 RepID=UPI002FD2F5C4